MPLPDLALTQNSSAASLGVCPPIFDAPRTFPGVTYGPCDNPTHVLPVQLVGVSGCADYAAAATKLDWSHNDANRPAGTASIL
jgi:hypothetical protein